METEKISDVLKIRRNKIEELLQQSIDLYPNSFKVASTVNDIKRFVEDPQHNVSENDPIFTTAGRIMAINRFGKTVFLRFRDRTGLLQAYLRKDRVGEEAYQLFKQLDIGDFIGLVGGMFKTRTGEWTLLVERFQLLCKALRPLPEKFHGLKDPEKRYRQRYIDLLMNPDIREIFVRRSHIIQAVRAFF